MHPPADTRGDHDAATRPRSTPARTPSVLIADDDPLTRRALVSIVDRSDRLTMAGFADDGPTAVAEALSLQPDLVLMDLGLPGLDGLSATLTIRRRTTRTRVVILASRVSDELLALAFRAGAAGAVVKDLPEPALVRTLEGVHHRGEAAVARSLTLPLLHRLHEDAVGGGRARARTGALTRRESQVLDLMADQPSLDVAARRLNVSPYTVRRHLRRIERKLGATTPQEAAATARRLREDATARPDGPDIDEVTLRRAVERVLQDHDG